MPGSDRDRVRGDGYRTADDGPEVEIKVRGSRFIGQVFHAGSAADASERLAAVRRRHHDARHHCSGLRLSSLGHPLERSDDDGEPSGTAGGPILGALRSRDLRDVLVVVTRYFGGVKLGTGGLARAYAEAASAALDAATARTVFRLATLVATCSYDDVGIVEATLARSTEDVVSVDRAFGERPRLVITVLASRAGSIAERLVEATAGRCAIERAPQADP